VVNHLSAGTRAEIDADVPRRLLSTFGGAGVRLHPVKEGEA
jgi:hypothetical protein